MFAGAMTALVTPFSDGQVDVAALRELVELQLRAGIDALIPCGTTGESATLSFDEQLAVIRTVVEQTRGRVPVIAGVGANATAEGCKRARAVEDLKVDGLLAVTPYYNKPTQAGLAAHFRALADATRLPLVMYNVPGRAGVDLLPDTVAELALHPRIVALKEATGSVLRTLQLLSTLQRAGIGEGQLTILSGDDGTMMPLFAVGARGVVSVVSNVVPDRVAALWDAVEGGHWAAARGLQLQLLPLIEALFVESNPIPIKAALSMAFEGTFRDELRLPLTPMSPGPRAQLRAALVELGVMS
jgi:4-hydroxy-tetrahydrodipicolinate synthase